MTKETAAAEQSARFSKEQILRSEKYAKRRDLLTAILKDDRAYTLADVDALIEKFMKGKVK